jgi:hypothetical protein
MARPPDFAFRRRRVLLDLFLERQQGWDMTQLQNRPNPCVVLFLQRLKLIEVPRIDHERLLADRVCVQA